MIFKRTFFLLVIILVGFISCQQEISEIIQPSQSEVLKPNTAETSLIKNVVAKDGSKDNIIDNASCISIQLPITVVVNGITVVATSEADYDIIEAILDKFDGDIDQLEIVFPIVIILNDFSQVAVNNFAELAVFVNVCGVENKIDDDIECVDFKYPISFSVFDSDNQLAETITIENDEQFYNLIDLLESNLIVEINFPVTMLLYDASEKIINDMGTLKIVIEDAKNLCDEDDNNDYNDDDINCTICSEQQISNMLVTCSWSVDELKINDEERTEQYSDYLFTFLKDGTVKANNNGNIKNGTWIIESAANGILVKINFSDLPDFSFNWVLNEIEDDYEINLEFGENKLELKKRCIDGELELTSILNEGFWRVSSFNDKGVNRTNDYADFVLDFKDDFSLSATQGTTVIYGTWNPQYDGGTVALELEFEEIIPFKKLNEDWNIIDLKNNRVEIKHIDSETLAISILVFERI